MVVTSEAACPKCLNDNGYTIMMSKDGNGVFSCRYNHRYKIGENGYFKPA